jgi:ABC-2 type transport system ATP-binding protein
LTELHLEGVTILVSTPYMDEAERCSRVGLLYQGRLVVCDTTERIKGMVEGELLELRLQQPGAEADQALRRARSVLMEVPGVLEVQAYGDLMHVFVDSVESGREAILRALIGAGFAATGVRQIRPRMEQAFLSLIRRQGMSDQDAEALLGNRRDG